MNAFGFKISPSSTINLDKIDKKRFERLCQSEPDALRCMSCGSCSATCPAAGFSGMSVRKVLLLLQRGKEEEAYGIMRNCMLCGKCTMVCPRGINTRHLILTICRIYKTEEAI
ncbi:MAG: 4Fe-4S dicluster domain-containing protein [Bacteroidales bacterium]|nr:4Fe-4S dicluster domain-containing protein [Bacteroidales bacterium]